MICYVERVVTDRDVHTDIKTLIPDAGLRRRMGKLIKGSVAAAVECLGGIDNIASLDAIITATGWGCLADSERFLRNIITDKEQFLNPTPFIQSTFNTVGGQIALLAHHHCYNVTYVNRSHSVEDALLDALMRMADGDSRNVLLGAFDELTPSLHRILGRMGLLRTTSAGEGVMFAHLTAEPTQNSMAAVTRLDFPATSLSKAECLARYATTPQAVLLYHPHEQDGFFPTASARSFARAVRLAADNTKEIIIYQEYMGGTPTVIVITCPGS